MSCFAGAVRNGAGVGLVACVLLAAMSAARGEAAAGAPEAAAEEKPGMAKPTQAAPTGNPMDKRVTEQADFVLYAPKGWRSQEVPGPGYRTLIVTDPSEAYEAAVSHGLNPCGNDLVALARNFVAAVAQQFAEFRMGGAQARYFFPRVVGRGTRGRGPALASWSRQAYTADL